MPTATHFAWCVALACSVAAAPARADSKDDAAAAFDAAVTAYQAGDFATAAQKFFAADRAAPNDTALANALAAAEEAETWPLAAQIAAAVESRRSAPNALTAKAREVAARAAPHVAQLALTCSDEPCALTLDGEPVAPGVYFVAPGEHEATRVGGSAMRVTCAAGASCPFTLGPAPEVATDSGPVASAPPPEVQESWKRHVPLAVFIGSSAAAATFIGLTTWKGVEARNARDLHDSDPDNYREKDVRDAARAADYMLGASILFTGAAVATGVWWVDWKSYRHGADARTSMSPTPGGAMLTHRVQF